MIGIVYKAIHKDTGQILKIGSTIKSIKSRAKDKFYADCVLSPVRVDVYEDSDFGILHLRVREAIEISKHRVWESDGSGGRNILNPAIVWISGVDDFEMRRYAGKKGGKKTFQLHGNPGTREGSIKGGRIAGRKNIDNGWASEMGKIYGGKYGNVLEKYRTKEHQSRAGRLGGLRAAKTNRASGQLKKLGETYGIKNLKRTPLSVKIAGFYKGRHIRWHEKKGIINPACILCQGGING